jgi:hypothetical protein
MALRAALSRSFEAAMLVVAIAGPFTSRPARAGQAAATPPAQTPQPPLSNPDTRLTTGVESLSKASSAGTQHLLVDLMVTAPLGGKTTRKVKPNVMAWFNARFNGASNSSFTGVSQFVAGFEDRLVSGDVASVFNALTFRAGLEMKMWGRLGNGADFLGDYQVQGTLIASYGVITVPAVSKPAIFEVSADARRRWNIPATHEGKTTPITFVGLTEPDRRRFFQKLEVGVRLKTHHFISCKGDAEPCDENERVHFPGLIDFTLGRDSSVTGGTLRGGVFTIDAFYPLPTDNVANAVYFFGRIRKHFKVARPVEDTPIILKAATESVAIPSDELWLHTLTADERTRDDWKFGLGVDLVRLLVLAKGKTAADAAAAITETGFSRNTVLATDEVDVVRLLGQPGERASFKHERDYVLPISDGRLDVLNATGDLTSSRSFQKHVLEPALASNQRYRNGVEGNFEALLLRVKTAPTKSSALGKLSGVTEKPAPGSSEIWSVATVECTAACAVTEAPAGNDNFLVIVPVTTAGTPSVEGGDKGTGWKDYVPFVIKRDAAFSLKADAGTRFVIIRVR